MKALRKTRRTLPPLNRIQLQELALRYVGRFATSRAKLRAYLKRKIRERGWDDAPEADLEALADRFAEIGYIDDSAFALARARSLTSRGYGKRRVTEQLRAAGIEEEHGLAARAHADEQAVTAALRFAERRKLGPFALSPALDRKERDKAIGTMVRAGHGFSLAHAIAILPPGAKIELDDLREQAGMTII